LASGDRGDRAAKIGRGGVWWFKGRHLAHGIPRFDVEQNFPSYWGTFVRCGAAVIVVIGVVAASLILFERSEGARLRQLNAVVQDKVRTGTAGSEDLDKVKADRDALAIAHGVLWLLHVLAIFGLVYWFLRLSRPTSPIRHRCLELPRDDAEVLHRLAPPQSPFQYGILSLLALMLAVAIACSALVYPLSQ
jgi:hypothetical protein